MEAFTLGDWITAKQASEILGVTATRVRQLGNAGELKCEPTPVGLLFSRRDVDRLQAERTAASRHT